MSTRIEWCDETWNPMTGCTPCSPACDHCYAERIIGRGMHGYDFTPRFHPDRLDKPLHWRKPRRIFVCSMSDPFHEAFTDEQRDEVFLRFAMCPAWPLDIEDDVPPEVGAHTFMVLTKRPESMLRYLTDKDLWWRLEDLMERQGYRGETMDLVADNTNGHTCFPNLWLGVTAENQQTADERIPILLNTPAAVRFVSVEPMLGPVDLGEYIDYTQDDEESIWRVSEHEPVTQADRERMFPKLDWVILGGETGPGARPMQPEWALDVYRQCKAACVPFFFKQAGTHWGREVGNAWAHPYPEMLTTRELPAVQQ